jgi:hypothetical protein
VSRLRFALTIAALFGAIIVLIALALRIQIVSDYGNEDFAHKTEERTQVTETPEETTALEETSALEETTAASATPLSGPPDSTLSYGGREVRVSVSASYCWGGGCFDGVETIPPRNKTLYVPSGSEMVFRYEAPRPPKKVSVSAASFDERGPFGEPTGSGGSLKAHGSGMERTIPAELPPGEYGVRVYVTDPQGDPHYLFRVMVE